MGSQTTLKLVSLAGHRRHLERRERRKVRGHLLKDARLFADDRHLAGYAIVIWDKDGMNYSTAWHCGGAIPAALLPEFAKRALDDVRIRAKLTPGEFERPDDSA